MNSTNIKIIIFISLLIIYLLVGEQIIERFGTITTCPNITITKPSILIDSKPEFVKIADIISKNKIINEYKNNNFDNINKKYNCMQSNYSSILDKL